MIDDAGVRLMLLAVSLPLSLLAAHLMGLAVKHLLRGRVQLSGTTITVVSVVGMSAGIFLVGAFDLASDLWSPVTVMTAFVVDAVVLTLVGAVLARLHPRAELPPVAEVIAAGESDRVEFKSSARWNLRTDQRDDRMELVVAKTVAAFLNSGGGTLLIGVADDGDMLGLAADFATLKQPDADRFELWLRDMLTTRLGGHAATLPRIDFAAVPGSDDVVCRVMCPPSPGPVYLRAPKSGAQELWVRVGNSTRALQVGEAIEYVAVRWPMPFGSRLRAHLRRLGDLAVRS